MQTWQACWNTFIINLNKNHQLKGSLSEKVASSSIELINSIVHNVQSQAWQEDNAARQHGEYLSLTFAQKFLIGKCAAEDGVIATVQYYSKPLLTIHQIHQFFSGITVLVTCQFITAKVSLCRYLSICYPTNISPCMVY